MLNHTFRAALQWAWLLPLRVLFILAGLLVVPVALPFRVTQGAPQPFTQAVGEWLLVTLPAWAWYWSNDRDGALGDKRGWWHLNAPFALGCYHWLSMFWWLAIRNPANNMRFSPLFGCPVTECEFRYWGQAEVEDDPGKGGWRLLLATHRNTGRRYYGLYWVWQWSASRAVVVQLGFKGEPSDWTEDYTGDLSGQWKGFTFEVNPGKNIE
ncbi:DUF7338 family protein [Pseudomonas aeruginosa]|uniref:DUF7338 family protein n=1 Tax=Pseudomonas aeruginosa TaxID=287 RepID=UPI00093A1D0D|nr:hypothetical protein [Pseudomonas aeruginosa]